MYLSSPRVNIAEESVENHRVQLQCKFDEMEGKYTEAKPRCTCPSYESNLHQVGEVQHQLPLDLMLVHFRPGAGGALTPEFEKCLEFDFTKGEMCNVAHFSIRLLLVKNPILPFGQK